MKKLLFIALCMLLSVGAFCQNINYGVKAGFNLSNFSGDDADLDTKAGIYLGGFVQIRMSEKFVLQPELVYSQQGSQDDEDGFSEKLRVDYLNIPLMVKYKLTPNFNLHAGPQIGVLLKSEYEIEDIDIDMKDETKGVELGLGLGMEYELSSGLAFNFRYNLGLTDVYEDSDIMNSVFQIGAAFKF